jgi:hypothetical protein
VARIVQFRLVRVVTAAEEAAGEAFLVQHLPKKCKLVYVNVNNITEVAADQFWFAYLSAGDLVGATIGDFNMVALIEYEQQTLAQKGIIWEAGTTWNIAPPHNWIIAKHLNPNAGNQIGLNIGIEVEN